MTPLKHDFWSFLYLDKANCKFANSCNLYSKANYTCTHEGGEYCGKYRILSNKPKVEVTL